MLVCLHAASYIKKPADLCNPVGIAHGSRRPPSLLLKSGATSLCSTSRQPSLVSHHTKKRDATKMLHEFISKTAPQGPALPLEDGDALVVVLKVPAASPSAAPHMLRPHETQKLATAMAADTFERFSCGECAQARRVCCFAPSDERKEASRLAPGWELSPMASRDLKSSDLGTALRDEYVRIRSQSRGAVVFLGSDAPDLPLDYVLDACACARQGTAALCEALDGGYVLLALPSNAPPEVFDHVKWSCSETANSQRERLQACGVAVRTLLGRWSDIDEVTDCTHCSSASRHRRPVPGCWRWPPSSRRCWRSGNRAKRNNNHRRQSRASRPGPSRPRLLQGRGPRTRL